MKLGAARAAAGLAISLAACGDAPRIEGCEASGPMRPLCGFQNPEDLADLPWTPWLLVSQMNQEGVGNLLALDRELGDRVLLYPDPEVAREPGWGAEDCAEPPDPFRPHGIDVRAEPGEPTRLAVVNHGGRDSVELFEVGSAEDGPALSWRGCAVLPPDTWPNDVALLPGGGFVVTSSAASMESLATAVRLLLGLDTGEVWEWTPDASWRAVPGTAASMPNGVAVSRDGQRVYLTAMNSKTLRAVDRDGGNPQEVPTPVAADNLSWDGEERLLTAGIPGGMIDLLGCRKVEGAGCGLAFAVVAIEPETLALETILEHDGASAFGGASVAVAIRDELWLGSFTGDRIARVRRRPQDSAGAR